VLTTKSQSNCNLDKIEPFITLKDSTNKIYYYHTGNSNYIAYYKNNTNRIIKTLFEMYFVSPNTLLKITGFVGKPLTKIDSLTNTVLYYSDPDDKYISFPTNTYILQDAIEVSRQKNKVNISIKVSSGQFYYNYDLEYTSKAVVSKKADINKILESAKLTCLKFTGNDM
jgi:hypothetical protein